LLSVLAGADAPTAGRARVDGWDLLALTNAERVRYRRHTVGFIRQQTARNLVPYLTARQVVELPMTFAGLPRRERAARSGELLDALGVRDVADRRPGQLSGGQQQRVAICVALANRPAVLLADEPTGELDTQTSAEVFAAFRRVNQEMGVTVVVVTHDPEVSGQVERTVAIRDGRTSSEVLRRTTRTADGADEVVAEEYAVMDRAGRVQVPREYREALALTERVRLALETDHVTIRPDRPPPDQVTIRPDGARPDQLTIRPDGARPDQVTIRPDEPRPDQATIRPDEPCPDQVTTRPDRPAS
jgi:ABC-type lipoprotein export system ATPase subunit/bifunctional DNA-binding transcriptional regulator/antitoxin component of YhaV-PrlF toxin-antitoxin module